MMAPTLPSIAERVADVRSRIAEAERASGRAEGTVRLVAVSKTHGPEEVLAALDADVVDFGENRVQELEAKADQVDRETGRSLVWHVIGPLQSNKVSRVANRGWWIHTLDRSSIVDKLARSSVDPSTQPVLVQVNVGRDPAKSGCTVAEAPALVARAVDAGLDVRGLMTIPPLPVPGADPADDARRHFSALYDLQQRLVADAPSLVELSMGMTSDLEAAVAEGATIVRIGTAVFGTRGDGPWQAGN